VIQVILLKEFLISMSFAAARLKIDNNFLFTSGPFVLLFHFISGLKYRLFAIVIISDIQSNP
jgi:hypothetical protein